MSALAMPWDSGKMLASVLWCSGSSECLGEGLRDMYAGSGLEVFSMPCSRFLSSATVDVFEEPTFEAIGLAVFIRLCGLLSSLVAVRRSHAISGQFAVFVRSHIWLHP